MKNSVVYDGALFCGDCSCGCPVASFNGESGMVTLNDPANPEKGEYLMIREE
jgi:hypothetical protein